MKWLRIKDSGTSIQRKVTLLVMLICMVALLITSVALIAYDFYSVQRNMVRELETLAEVVAINSAATITFQLPKDADEQLAILKAGKNITMARIYDVKGNVFASYYRSDVDPGEEEQPFANEGHHLSAGHLDLVREIRLGDDTLGTVYLQSDMSYIKTKFWHYLYIVASVFFLTMVVAALLTTRLQKFISSPILNLAKTAKRVSQKKDYSIRAIKHTNDEIGFLTQSFNVMLSQIEDREKALQAAHQKVAHQAGTLRKELQERKVMEQDLRASEERFRDLFDKAPDIYVILDPPGKVVDFNERGLKKLGYNTEDVLEKPFTNIVTPAAVSHVKGVLKQILNGRDLKNMETQLVGKDGQTYSVIKEFSVWQDKSKKIKLILVICRDITERKQLLEELERAHRLETAGRIAGQIAHDFNNLLGPLAAYPSLIREDLPERHPVLEMVDEMEAAAMKIAEINHQLLSLGRRGHYAMEPLDLNNLIEKVLPTVKLADREKIKIRSELATDLFFIRGGDAQLTRALSNLIQNAVEAVGFAGRITISTSNIYLEKPLHGYKKVNQGEYVKLMVQDSGHGISSDIINKIFDPFFTTKTMDRMRGSGLGLSVVHGVIEDHDGYITVESQVAKGTTFTIYFPVLRDVQIDKISVSGRLSGGHERILIVDDDPVQRKVTSFLLERLGYETETAASGEQALEHVRRKKPDLLILDMVMEGIDGAETYKRILKKYPAQKAIVLSGYAMSKRVKHALQLGAGKFISKPVSLPLLAKAVRAELDDPSPLKQREESMLAI